MNERSFGWWSILRLGAVQAAIGAITMLATSLLNRLMVLEYKMVAAIPAGLVAWHYAVQLSRAAWGRGSDLGRRRTPWILGGMAVLGMGALLAVKGVTMLDDARGQGLALLVVAFALIGAGVGAAGTSLLALLATGVAPERRAAAAAITWMMMIFGIVVAAGTAGALLDPYSEQRLIGVASGVVGAAVLVAVLATFRLEGDPAPAEAEAPAPQALRPAIARVLADPEARAFTLFVFVSMLAYSMQDLILEPFTGLVFGMTPGQSTSLSGLQNGGVLVGMILSGIGGSAFRGRLPVELRTWTMIGCIGSALALAGLAMAAWQGAHWPLAANIALLGVFNGAFAVSAIGSMMGLASAVRHEEGLRMGLWGTAQAIAFGLGGLIGAVGVDLVRPLFAQDGMAFATIFAAEAGLFVWAALLAMRVRSAAAAPLHSGQAPAQDDCDYDVVVVGGGPAGATAACDLAQAGRKVLLLDRDGRIKPCGGAVPPRLIEEFEVPLSLLVARARAARMVAPSNRAVDMPVGDIGYVGMVDRDVFDEWLRERAATAGAERRTGTYESIERDGAPGAIVCFREERGEAVHKVRARLVIGADGARSAVARGNVAGAGRNPCVFAYHEVIRAPGTTPQGFDAQRCDVVYQGRLSPDFYGWVFPHGETASIGVGSAHKGFSLRGAVRELRGDLGLDGCETIRSEGAPIPLKPLKRWDNGRDVLLAGDAAGVVAPASGEGIYYAMTSGRIAAETATAFLATANPAVLRRARAEFLKAHGRVFWILGIMQHFWYASDKRRESFVAMCADRDVQQLTWQAYMNKRLVRRQPMAHVRIFLKDCAHLLGFARTPAGTVAP